MKHLKRFNESVDMEAELKSFTEDCLAYLMDEGLNVEVEKSVEIHAFRQEGYDISLFNSTREFTWNQIKDYYIPFIQLLSNRYEIINMTGDYTVKIGANYSGYYYYTYEDIVNDRVGVTRFNSIMVRVK